MALILVIAFVISATTGFVMTLDGMIKKVCGQDQGCPLFGLPAISPKKTFLWGVAFTTVAGIIDLLWLHIPFAIGGHLF